MRHLPLLWHALRGSMRGRPAFHTSAEMLVAPHRTPDTSGGLQGCKAPPGAVPTSPSHSVPTSRWEGCTTCLPRGRISPGHKWGIRSLPSPPLHQQPRGAERREGRAAPAGSRHRADTDVPVASLHKSGHRFCFSCLILSKQKNKTRSLRLRL